MIMIAEVDSCVVVVVVIGIVIVIVNFKKIIMILKIINGEIDLRCLN